MLGVLTVVMPVVILIEGEPGELEPMSATATVKTPAHRNDQKPTRRDHGGSPLERVTVNLIARASRALQLVSDLTGDSKTDSINRAIQVYAYLEEINANGGIRLRPRDRRLGAPAAEDVLAGCLLVFVVLLVDLGGTSRSPAAQTRNSPVETAARNLGCGCLNYGAGLPSGEVRA